MTTTYIHYVDTSSEDKHLTLCFVCAIRTINENSDKTQIHLESNDCTFICTKCNKLIKDNIII